MWRGLAKCGWCSHRPCFCQRHIHSFIIVFCGCFFSVSCYCTSFCPLKNLLDWSFLVGLLPLFSLLPALRCFSRRSSSVCLFNPSSFCWWRKDEAHLQGPSIFAFLPPYDISLTLNLSCLQDLKQQKFTIDAEPSETVSFDVL